VHFTSTKAKTEGSRNVRFVNALQERGPDWETDAGFSATLSHCASEPMRGVGFGELPGYAMNADNFKPISSDFEDWIYRHERAELFYSPLLKEYSQFGEGERDFRARLSQSARETRDEAIEKLRDKYASADCWEDVAQPGAPFQEPAVPCNSTVTLSERRKK